MKTSEKLKKNVKPIVIAGAAVACLGIAGVSAYFTDAAKITNTFTVGKVEVTPNEPDWDPPKDIVPNQEFDKNPEVKNTGVNEAYVFVKVKIPKAKIAYADQDGTKQNTDLSKAVPLFRIAYNDSETPGFNNAKWAEVPGTAVDNDTEYTRVFVYGTSDKAAALAKDATTESLFDTIKFANVLEGQDIEGSKLDVDVTTYAIQTTYLNDGTNDGADGSTATTPEAIWAILEKQAPTVEDVTSSVTEDNEP